LKEERLPNQFHEPRSKRKVRKGRFDASKLEDCKWKGGERQTWVKGNAIRNPKSGRGGIL